VRSCHLSANAAAERLSLRRRQCHVFLSRLRRHRAAHAGCLFRLRLDRANRSLRTRDLLGRGADRRLRRWRRLRDNNQRRRRLLGQDGMLQWLRPGTLQSPMRKRRGLQLLRELLAHLRSVDLVLVLCLLRSGTRRLRLTVIPPGQTSPSTWQAANRVGFRRPEPGAQ